MSWIIPNKAFTFYVLTLFPFEANVQKKKKKMNN